MRAQTPANPLPEKPVLRRAAAFASWTVTFKYKNEDATQPPLALPAGVGRVRAITVTKTDKTYLEQVTLTSGTTYEKWIFDNVQLRTVPGSPSIIPIDPPADQVPDSDYSDHRRSDFPNLEWVSIDNYRSVEKDQGKPAFRFESEGKTALLSVETQMPLSYANGETVCSYVFNPPPSAPLTPPEKFRIALETHKKGLEGLKYRPSLP